MGPQKVIVPQRAHTSQAYLGIFVAFDSVYKEKGFNKTQVDGKCLVPPAIHGCIGAGPVRCYGDLLIVVIFIFFLGGKQENGGC
jgi:hypothetical protein